MSRAWVLLVIAGLLETVWSVGLKYSQGFSRPVPSTITMVAALSSFYLLGLALRDLPVGTAYAVWTGIGAVGAATFGILFLHESRETLRLVSLVFILAGIAGLRLTSKV